MMTTTFTTGMYYSILRSTFTAAYGTKFVFVTLLKAGAKRIEIYQVDPKDGIEMFLQYANPELIGVVGGHGLVDAALIVHLSEMESRGYKLTPMSDWT